jgi:flavin reductase (DIM6/NTAB) family NADH-FMN oxidoreductase RutF
MSIVRQCRQAIKKIVFGNTLLPQEFTIGLKEPQTEITVWLHGMSIPLDVTWRHSTVCSEPFTLCIAFDQERRPAERDLKHLSLQYRERDGEVQLLGEIGLKFITSISVAGSELFLFEPRSSANYCLPKIRLGVHDLQNTYSLWRNTNTSGITMSLLERRAAAVTFIRPHPVALGSTADEEGGNIFPMNIMGELGHGLFAFALKSTRTTAPLVARVGCIAISSVPLAQAPFVFQLAANHFKPSINWEQLPFRTKPSTTFNLPIPAFAQRVREMKIERVHRIGSHTLFIARIVCDETFTDGPGLSAIHGFYQFWRLKGRTADLKVSLAEHLHNKGVI